MEKQKKWSRVKSGVAIFKSMVRTESHSEDDGAEIGKKYEDSRGDSG